MGARSARINLIGPIYWDQARSLFILSLARSVLARSVLARSCSRLAADEIIRNPRLARSLSIGYSGVVSPRRRLEVSFVSLARSSRSLASINCECSRRRRNIRRVGLDVRARDGVAVASCLPAVVIDGVAVASWLPAVVIRCGRAAAVATVSAVFVVVSSGLPGSILLVFVAVTALNRGSGLAALGHVRRLREAGRLGRPLPPDCLGRDKPFNSGWKCLRRLRRGRSDNYKTNC